MFKQLQKIGKSFMLPIAILPAAGLLLGIGGALSNPNTVQAYPFLDIPWLQGIFQVMSSAGDVVFGLPAAGLLLGIGGALSNPNTVQAYPFLDIPWLQGIFQVMSSAGDVVFGNLALIMCIGLAVGLAKKDKGTAALAGAVAFLVMNASIKGMINAFNPAVGSIDTGVVGSIVIGSVVAYLHNRYSNIQLPSVLGFFGGSRFVPIVSSFTAIFIGAVFFMIWPTFQNWLVTIGNGIANSVLGFFGGSRFVPIVSSFTAIFIGAVFFMIWPTFQNWLVTIGNGIANLGPIGTFLYGFLLRLTGAVGLHHMIYPLFWYSELGGVAQVAGQTVVGAQNIFFAQLADQ